MKVCVEKNAVRGKILTNALNTEQWWNHYKYNKKTGEITETPLTGEELYGLFLHKVLFKHYEITVIMGQKEYFICEKNKSWEKGENYDEEIKNSFWSAYRKGILTGKKEKLSKKQLIQTEENGKIK